MNKKGIWTFTLHIGLSLAIGVVLFFGINNLVTYGELLPYDNLEKYGTTPKLLEKSLEDFQAKSRAYSQPIFPVLTEAKKNRLRLINEDILLLEQVLENSEITLDEKMATALNLKKQIEEGFFEIIPTVDDSPTESKETVVQEPGLPSGRQIVPQ